MAEEEVEAEEDIAAIDDTGGGVGMAPAEVEAEVEAEVAAIAGSVGVMRGGDPGVGVEAEVEAAGAEEGGVVEGAKVGAGARAEEAEVAGTTTWVHRCVEVEAGTTTGVHTGSRYRRDGAREFRRSQPQLW